MLILILFCLYRKGTSKESLANLTRCFGAHTENCLYFDQCAKTVSTFLTLLNLNCLILDQSGTFHVNCKCFVFVQVKE